MRTFYKYSKFKLCDCKLKNAAERLDEKITIYVTNIVKLKTDDDGSEERELPGQLSTFQTMQKHLHPKTLQ